ncbi:tRNA (adenine(58)-N(1))-methyltransferase catalytic subunit TRM61 [Diutina catenulata]
MFGKTHPTIQEGDFVLVFISRGSIKPINVTKGESVNSRYGNFVHDDMIGRAWGSQMPGANSRGFVHLLRPTPELWTLSLPHRTQIVYTHDSAYIMQRMQVTAGSTVLEAGTGSASFTHAFSRTIGDGPGHLYTYEFHGPRYEEAKKELADHGLTNTTITHRDVCADGFGIEGVSQKADAVFLDLPSPWDAIPHLPSVMATESKIHICCFSPCIEQVDKTVKALEEHGWTDIEMVEVNQRRWESRLEMKKDVSDVIQRLKNIKQRKEQGIEALKDKKAEEEGRQLKRPKTEPVQDYNPFGRGTRVREGDEGYQWENVTRVEPEVKSHTSYLTFAVKVPLKKATAAE